MPYDSSRHHRRSIRLRGYDYTQSGWYFVTICTHMRQPLFGTIADDAMHANDAGRLILYWWGELANKFSEVTCDAFVVMPDHCHGIVTIGAGGDRNDAVNAGGHAGPLLRDDSSINDAVGVDRRVHPQRYPTDRDGNGDGNDDSGDIDVSRHPKLGRSAGPPLPQMLQWFKTMTTNAFIRGVNQGIYPPFERRVWQRGYYERIIRDERELAAVRRYIVDNPARHAARLDALLARMHYRETQ